MAGRFFKKKREADPSTNISREEADRILGDIFEELEIEEKPNTRRRPYYARVLRSYILKNMVIACGVILACFMVPGTVAPAPITSVSAAPAADSASVKVEFNVSSLIPVQEIRASLDDSKINVEEKGFQRYVVEVNKNGYLLLEVYSVTGLHSSHGMQIDSIDDQAPSITSHFESGGNIYVYLTDGEGSGVDYPSVCVSDPAAGSCCEPLYYDEQYGYVVLPYPETEVYITVPDKEGNEMTALLTPSESPE